MQTSWTEIFFNDCEKRDTHNTESYIYNTELHTHSKSTGELSPDMLLWECTMVSEGEDWL